MVQKQLVDEIVRIICELRDGDIDELVRYDLKLGLNRTEDHPWKRLCSYKSEKDSDSECDKSLRIMIIFWLSFGFNRWKIRRKGDNFELRSKGKPFVMRGDVMNSYAATVRIYLSLEGVLKNKRQNINELVLKHYDNEQMLHQLYEANTDFAEFIKLIARGESIITAVKSRLDEYEKVGIGPEKLAEDMCTRV